ncbi:MAG TPA: diguanylate cyclase, partial [Woeseiaceae bacterium]|nr:diguanylate cyclase [Woeseiaceae bacterium]
MTGHSILYLGRGDFASEYLAELETLPCCSMLARSSELRVPVEKRELLDIVLLEAGPVIARSGQALSELIHALRDYPVVAVTDKEHEHRGIAAVRSGAQGYICIDDVTVEGQEAIFDHAVRRQRLQQRLSDTDVSVLSVLASINDGVIVVDREGSILDVNPAARSILGLGPRWQPDASWEQTFCCIDEHGDNDRNPEHLPLVRARSGARFTGQVAIYRAPEQPDTYLSISGQGLYDGNRELVGGVITFRDVTDTTIRTIALEKRAQYDELTGLPNRGVFTEYLLRAIGRAGRKHSPLAVLFIDLDRFKSVNETLGHDVGDDLLRQVAGRLRDNLRVGDFAGRWRGDEFVVCLEDFGEMGNAGAAAQKLLLVLSEKYQVGHSEVYATPSIGIAIYPESGNNAERLVKAADIAMHEAKKSGGGRFHYYSTALNARLEQREELEVGLRHA